MPALIAYDEVLRLDAELVRLSRGVASVRLRAGEAFEALASSGGHHELGFSSLEAYARERCERTGRWAADTRALARRLAELPHIREALRAGWISWSMAELLARSVVTGTELEWLERARNATIREMRALLREERRKKDAAGSGSVDTEEKERLDTLTDPEDDVPNRLLAVTVTDEDGWMFECARKVAEHLEGRATADAVLRSLLAEGLSTLLQVIPENRKAEIHALETFEKGVEAERKAQAGWCAQRERLRIEAEARCRALSRELETCAQADEVSLSQPDNELALPETPEAIDRELRRLCSELAERDLQLGIMADRARRSDVWLRVGFASEVHYARERLGVSLSSLNSKRVLAARAVKLPELVTALSSGVIGYEAAYLVSRVATPTTLHAWLERARARTVKYLREEVDAAELFVRFGQGREQWPPDEATMQQLFEIERRVTSGELLEGVGSADSLASAGGAATETMVENAGDDAVGGAGNSQIPGTPPEMDSVGNDRVGGAGSTQLSGASLEIDDADSHHVGGAGDTQMSGGPPEVLAATRRRLTRAERSFGCVTYRWHVSADTYRFWRALERVFAQVRSAICTGPVSFLHFLCDNFCRTWLPVIRRERLTGSGTEPAYFRIYRRDGFRCTSPVCTRRDLTPHHLKPRSAGGGEEDENLTSLCIWCHIRGIHEGRITADPPASHIRWRIGRKETLRVEGRTRV